MGEQILVVDDDKAMLDVIVEMCLVDGHEVKGVASGKEAIQDLQETAYDILLTDIRLPDLSGIDVLRGAMEIYPDMIVIMITGHGTIEDAVATMKLGAYDYILKPINMVELSTILKKAVERRDLKRENQLLSQQLKKKYRFDNIVGNSEKMIEIFKVVEKVAQSTATVLICGESGTGKELIARAIHYNSPRKDKPLVSVNCGAIPENLLEDELFGHVKGAFTDAVQSRPGRFEQAHRGTLFLDEIGNMSPALQIKLLRVLQERQFERVGSPQSVQVDVRIIAATSADLDLMVAEATFRKDLFYRLNVIRINLPPLRDRKSDIPLLAHHCLEKICKEEGKKPRIISQSVMKVLLAYDWAGNVRELENILERAVALMGDRDQVLPTDLPPELHNPINIGTFTDIDVPDEGICFNTVVSSLEKELILRALKKTSGNKKLAAQLLNLKRTTLLEKLKRLQPVQGSEDT
ncbi:sigma-54-dependent transcriptional regulator [Acidobacteriota bacterium]